MREHLKIAILMCDTPLEGTQKHYGGGYDKVFTDLLYRGADRLGIPQKNLELSSWDVVTAMEYPNLEDIDAILITGSKHDSFSTNPWTEKLVSFTQTVLAQPRVRIIGVCYGHQIVARALGTQPARNTAGGWEVAVTPIPLSPRGAALFGAPTLRLHQMHQDAVPAHPAGVEPLGATQRCAVQGMFVPRRLVTVQGHPEFTGAIVRELLEARHASGVLTDAVFEDGMARVDDEHDGVKVAAAFLDFLREEGEFEDVEPN